jgi:hypothetical protein
MDIKITEAMRDSVIDMFYILHFFLVIVVGNCLMIGEARSENLCEILQAFNQE